MVPSIGSPMIVPADILVGINLRPLAATMMTSMGGICGSSLSKFVLLFITEIRLYFKGLLANSRNPENFDEAHRRNNANMVDVDSDYTVN